MNVGLGSTNAAKLSAVTEAFEALAKPVILTGVKVPSGVSDQPMSDRETLEGAINRARATLQSGPFDLAIGLEGGVDDTPLGMVLCNWCAVLNKQGEVGIGGGVRMRLPEEIATEVRAGRELGDVIDEYAGGHDIRSGEGTIGILTNGSITRSRMFRDSIICALSSLK